MFANLTFGDELECQHLGVKLKVKGNLNLNLKLIDETLLNIQTEMEPNWNEDVLIIISVPK